MWSLFSGEGVVFHAQRSDRSGCRGCQAHLDSSAPVTQTDMDICSDRDARAADAATH